MIEDINNSYINVDSTISPQVLAGLLGINVSLVYQESQAGRLPNDLSVATYRQCVQQYVNYYKKKQDLKIEKEKHDQELKLEKLASDEKVKLEKARLAQEEATRVAKMREEKQKNKISYSTEGDDSIHPLMAIKIKQNIKTERAREEQLIQKNAIERQDYIDKDEQYELVEPFVTAIADVLKYIAGTTKDTEVQKKVDEGMEELHQLGVTLLEKVEIDAKNYVKVMLEREFDAEEIDDIEEEVDED